MTCRRSGRLAALAAGDDLRVRDRARYRAHASRCDACRAAELALRDLLETLRSIPAPEFTQTEHAQLRAKVWQAIRCEKKTAGRPVGWFRFRRLAPAAALAAAALFGLLVLARRQPVRIEPAAPLSTIVAQRESVPPVLSVPARAPRPQPTRPPRVAVAKRRRPAADAGNASAPVRLEIATPNLDVRIIWLFDSGDAAADAAADATPTEEVS